MKVLALILSIGALPLVFGMTGCTSTGNRYTQSTGERLDDNALTSHVKRALGEDNQYKFGDVNVVTFKGVVQLNGFVNSLDQKSRAGDIAKKIPGVTEVKNSISVKQ